MQALQYTIRKLPREIDKMLRRKAREEHLSLNETVLNMIKRGIGLDEPEVKHHDLDFLIGSWQDDKAAEQAILDQRRIEPEKWS